MLIFLSISSNIINVHAHMNAHYFMCVFTLYELLIFSQSSDGLYYSPALKKGGYTGFGLSVIPSFRQSVIILFPFDIFRTKDRISPNFAYASISTKSSWKCNTSFFAHL